MHNTEALHEFATALTDQARLLNELADGQSHLREAVAARDWDTLEHLLPKLTEVGRTADQAEQRRGAALDRITGPEKRDFSVVLAALPDEHRRRVSDGYRDLKVAVLRLKSHTQQMETYLQSSIATTRSVVRELCPEHASGGYTPDGQGTFQTAAAMMVNKRM